MNKYSMLALLLFGLTLTGCNNTRKVKVYPVTGFAVAGDVTYQRVTPTVNFLGGISKVKDEAPVGCALVQVLDTSDNNKVIAEGSTNEEGVFNIGLPPELQNSPLQVRVLTVSGLRHFPMAVMDQTTEKRTYHALSEVFIGTKNDVGIRITDGLFSGTLSSAFNVFSQIMRGYKFMAREGGENGTFFQELQVFWESGKPGAQDCTCFFKGFFSPATINLRADENDDAVILHEFGHYLQFAFSHSSSPGGDHFLTCDQNDDPRLTWSEGWATGFSLMVRRSEFYIDTDNQNFYLAHEVPCHIGQGSVSETVVAAMYLDLYDGFSAAFPSKDADTIGISFILIWEAMKDVKAGSRLTVYDFYVALINSGAVTRQQWADNFTQFGLTEASMISNANAAPQTSPGSSPEVPPGADPEFYAIVE